MKNITLKELAKQLNLSISTVSKAINDSHEISNETKQKVKELVNELNYRPNIVAKNLKTGRSNTLGLIIPFITNPFQTQILEGAQKAAVDHNLNLIFMQSSENTKLEEEAVNSMVQQNIDGIIISPSANTNEQFLHKMIKQIPTVLVDRIDFDVPTHRIGVNSEKGAFLATQHLIDKGRKEIVAITGKNIGVNQKRISGYKKALLANYIEYNPNNVINVEYGQHTKDLVKNLSIILERKMKDYKDPIGILGITDTLTVNTLGILAKLGYRVPEDVSVIGFANTEYAESLNPSLSSIFQPANAMGYQAVEKLLEIINHKNADTDDFDTLYLETELILRNSTSN
ncbi:LacI family DNA-binding transcriptional regulator [Sphingobacterium kyonggiense]